MSRLTRNGTAEPDSRDHFSGANEDEKMFIFPVQLTTSRIGNLTRLILTFAICDDHTCIHTYYSKGINILRSQRTQPREE